MVSHVTMVVSLHFVAIVYCFNRADFDKMKHSLIYGIEKLCIDNNADIDVIWNELEGVIKSLLRTVNSVFKKNVSKIKSLPWMTRDIRKMCTKKKLLYERAKSSNSNVAWQKFTECSNKVKALIRKSHKVYTYDISLNAKRNPKKFWSYVASKRRDVASKRNLCSDSNSFNINDSVISNLNEIADAFNKHFCCKFGGMYSPLDLGSLPDTPTSHGGPPLCFDLFTIFFFFFFFLQLTKFLRL